MKQFIKNIFSSCFGIFFALILFFIVVVSYVTYKVSSSAEEMQKETVENNSILKITLAENISERSVDDPFENLAILSGGGSQTIGLSDIVKSIYEAKDDERIKGIYLKVSGVSTNMANLEEIRNALMSFKKSKKFIYAYGEGISQAAYYVSTVSDSIWLNPVGMLQFTGLSSEVIFLKNALAKLEVEPQIIRHGKFKSAIEPLINESMSPENRKQVSTYLNATWNHMLKGIAEKRNISVDGIQGIVNSGKLANAKSALSYKLIDGLRYEDEVLNQLALQTNTSDINDIKFISLNSYNKSVSDKNFATVLGNTNASSKNRIAIIYANGDIESGKGSDEAIGSDRFTKTIREARLDKAIKAVVLRINSPGGSSLASDVIWREISLTKKVKPVVVSMGGVAASGGYYIACNANKIIANPTTITGSIGVFGVLLNAKGLLNNKLGITIDTVKTGTFADIGTISRPLTSQERDIIQQQVEIVYEDFITKVAEGRGMTKAQVDSIGQGRVWNAIDAKRIGLVDELGGIDIAVIEAAKLAKINDYKIYNLPKKKNSFENLNNILQGKEEVNTYIKENLGMYYNYLFSAQQALKQQGIQMKMEYNLMIK